MSGYVPNLASATRPGLLSPQGFALLFGVQEPGAVFAAGSDGTPAWQVLPFARTDEVTEFASDVYVNGGIVTNQVSSTQVYAEQLRQVYGLNTLSPFLWTNDYADPVVSYDANDDDYVHCNKPAAFDAAGSLLRQVRRRLTDANGSLGPVVSMARPTRQRPARHKE